MFFFQEGKPAEFLTAWRHSAVFYAMGDFSDEFYDRLIKPRIPYSSYDTDFARLILRHEPDRKEYHRFLLDLEPSEILYLIDAANWKNLEPEFPVFIKNILENGELIPGCRVLIAVLDPDHPKDYSEEKCSAEYPFSWIHSLELHFFSSEKALLKEAAKGKGSSRGSLKSEKTMHGWSFFFQHRGEAFRFPLKEENCLQMLRDIIIGTSAPAGEPISLLQAESPYIAGMYRNLFDAASVQETLQREQSFLEFGLHTVWQWEQMDARRDISLQDFLQEKTERVAIPFECVRLQEDLGIEAPFRTDSYNIAEIEQIIHECGYRAQKWTDILLFQLNLYYIQMVGSLLHLDRLILDEFHGRCGAGFGDRVYDMTGRIRLSNKIEPG